jgi:ABC-2 type transport system ATP-binding protein
MISIRDVSKRFGKTVAIDHLSLEIGQGDIFGLIGPDGAGKTTTMRIIATAMAPSSGSVLVDGIDAARQPEAIKKLIGYMPQRFALYGDLTVLENLNFFADVFGSPRAERKALIDRLLGFARLTNFQSRRAANLSGGMQKKLALAATLMHRPRILLLDEPTTGVDPVSRREFWDLLTQVHLDGVTVLVSTPYMDEAERCTHVGLMHRGKLIAHDKPGNLRANLGAVVLEGQSNTALGARRLAQGAPGVFVASAHGDVVRMLVDHPERQGELERLWASAGMKVQQVRPVRARLEDAFVMLLERTPAAPSEDKP